MIQLVPGFWVLKKMKVEILHAPQNTREGESVETEYERLRLLTPVTLSLCLALPQGQPPLKCFLGRGGMGQWE